MLILNVINILKKYSSKATPMTQSEILDKLNKDYGVHPDRKTLRSALLELVKQYDGAEYTESGRKGWYFRGILNESEQETVVRALLFSPETEREEIDSISEKISQGSASVRKYKNVIKPKKRKSEFSDKEMLETLFRGIHERRMLTFSVCVRKCSGVSELEREPDGYVREYLVRPISVMVHNGSFSLLGSLGDSGRMKFFPLDRLYGVKLSDVECIVMPQFEEGSYIYPENEAEERLPRGGARSEVKLKVRGDILFDIQSSFSNVAVQPIGENLFEVTFRCNLSSARRYIISLGDGAEVISPPSLRGEVAAIFFRMAERYRR